MCDSMGVRISSLQSSVLSFQSSPNNYSTVVRVPNIENSDNFDDEHNSELKVYSQHVDISNDKSME